MRLGHARYRPHFVHVGLIIRFTTAKCCKGSAANRSSRQATRLRQLVVQPGGTVAWHSHEERPAIIYIVSGTITEYASTCTVPIVHKAGDVARETHTTKHWWKNSSKKPAVLLSADILHDKMNQHQM